MIEEILKNYIRIYYNNNNNNNNTGINNFLRKLQNEQTGCWNCSDIC